MIRRFALGAAVLAVFLSGAGCSSKEGVDKASVARAGKPDVSVDAEAAATGDVSEGIEVTGTLSPKHQAEMKSEYGGVVAQVYVNDWAKVRKGDPLLKVDTREGEVLLLKAKAALQMAKAGQLEAESALSRADREYGRAVKLQESGLITRQGMDDARTQQEAAGARIAAANAQDSGRGGGRRPGDDAAFQGGGPRPLRRDGGGAAGERGGPRRRDAEGGLPPRGQPPPRTHRKRPFLGDGPPARRTAGAVFHRRVPRQGVRREDRPHQSVGEPRRPLRSRDRRGAQRSGGPQGRAVRQGEDRDRRPEGGRPDPADGPSVLERRRPEGGGFRRRRQRRAPPGSGDGSGPGGPRRDPLGTALRRDGGHPRRVPPFGRRRGEGRRRGRTGRCSSPTSRSSARSSPRS